MGFPPLARSAMLMIGINVAVWVLMLVLYYASPAAFATLVEVGALQPEMVLRGYVHQLFTYMFIHSWQSPFHVLMNMLLVYFFASPIEQRFGVKKTIGLALAGGLVGGLMVMVFYGLGALFGLGGPSLTIGFSGAAFALLAAFCWIHAEAQILLFFVIPIKAKYILPLTLAIDFLFWVTPGGDVSFPAHLGGMLLGTLAVTDAWMPQSLMMRLRYWKIRRELDKRDSGKGGAGGGGKGGKKGKDDKIVNGPWLH